MRYIINNKTPNIELTSTLTNEYGECVECKCKSNSHCECT